MFFNFIFNFQLRDSSCSSVEEEDEVDLQHNPIKSLANEFELAAVQEDEDA